MVHTDMSHLDARGETERVIAALAAEQGLKLTTVSRLRVRRALMHVPAALALIVIAVVSVALVSGWKSIVIRSGSMADRAPIGSLAIASSGSADAVEVGDMIVMRPEGSPTVTHAVVSFIELDGSRFAITKGTANQARDPVPYLLEGKALTVRVVIPHVGRAIAAAQAYWIGLTLLLAAALVMTGNRKVEPADPPQSLGRARV